jgi:succinoglycan biosynthesis transport protein ExoP
MYRLPHKGEKNTRTRQVQPEGSGGSLLDQLEDIDSQGAYPWSKAQADVPEQASETYRHKEKPQLQSLADYVSEDEEPSSSSSAAASSSRAASKPRAPKPAPASPGSSSFLPGLSQLNLIGLGHLVDWLRRGIVWIVLSIILCAVLALAYASMLPPRYTAYTDVVVNPANLNVVNDGVYTPSQQRDTLVLEVESKLRTLTSRNVLERAVNELNLDQDPEFTGLTPIARLKSLWTPVIEGDNKVAALRGLGDRVSATRDPRSFVVTLAVWSNDGDKSVRIAQSIMSAFETELFEGNSEGSRRAAADLNLRLEELRRNVTEAEQKIEEYRAEHNLQQVNGQLASDQASGELNAQVLSAQQRVIQEESRLAQMEAALKQNRLATAAIFDSQTMNTIREQYSLLQQQIGAMTLTYGSRHPRLASAGAERQMLEQGMQSEARRIIDIARAGVEEARAAQAALKKSANTEQSRVFADNAVMVTLRDLERDARSVAAIYETYLTRSRQITEQQAIDSTNIRIISQPVAPNYRSWPPGKLTFLIGGIVLGTLIGAAIAIAFGLLGFLRRPRPYGY